MAEWMKVCTIRDILPETGICALVDHEHVAIFRPTEEQKFYAISNIDPFAQASVLSRGLIVEHQESLWVASPLKKQRFRLKDGVCFEDAKYNIQPYEVRIEGQDIEVKTK